MVMQSYAHAMPFALAQCSKPNDGFACWTIVDRVVPASDRKT
jgi:hypothetical protein